MVDGHSDQGGGSNVGDIGGEGRPPARPLHPDGQEAAEPACQQGSLSIKYLGKVWKTVSSGKPLGPDFPHRLSFGFVFRVCDIDNYLPGRRATVQKLQNPNRRLHGGLSIGASAEGGG